MTSYKLNENVAEFFEFELGGFTYKMKYPNGEERRKMAELGQKVMAEAGKAQRSQDAGDTGAFELASNDAEKVSSEMSKLINSLITPGDEKAPGIDTSLDDASTPVLRNFQNMIQAELSLDVPKQVGK